jgi:hypothetical protein
MDSARSGVLILLVSVLFFVTAAQATTTLVNVYEKDGNISLISQASIYADGALIGKTDSSGNLDFSHPGTSAISIRVEKLGFDDFSQILDPNLTYLQVELFRKNLTLETKVYDADTLEPIAGAQVQMSGGGTSGSAISDLNGSASFAVRADEIYTLDIKAMNYQSRAATVEMGTDSKQVQYWLFRDDRFALVVKDDVTGLPLSDAEVAIEGVVRGITDTRGAITLQLPREKVYNIRVKKEGYQDYNGRQVIGKDEALVTILLAKAPYNVFISVFDENKEPVEGAFVTVNGKEAGVTNKFGRLTLEGYLGGDYNLTVSAGEYADSLVPLVINAQGQDITVELSYKTIDLTIFAQEPGEKMVDDVTILLNGKEIGITDAHGQLETQVKVNTAYTINATKEGYLPAGVSQVFSSEKTSANVTLIMEKPIDIGLVAIIVIIIAAVVGVILWIRRKNRYAHTRMRRGGL